jgi:phage tail-like protein
MIQLRKNGLANGLLGRAFVPELASPHPLGAFLPALYQQDDFAQRWTAALDLVLAPVFNSLDNFEAYLDPRLAPPDFLDWLGTWMGLISDETWPTERRRAFISQASELYRIRGTPRGLASHVQIFSGGEVEILEHGGTSWSTESGAALPGSPGFDLVVRVRVEDPASIDVMRLNALIAAAKPAHLVHRVEVVAAPRPATGSTPAKAEPQSSGPGEVRPPNEERSSQDEEGTQPEVTT